MAKRDSSRKEVLKDKQKAREQRMSKLKSAGAGSEASPPRGASSNSSEQSMAAFLSPPEDSQGPPQQMTDEDAAQAAAMLQRINSGAAMRTDGASNVELLNWLTRTLHIASATAQQYVRAIDAQYQANASSAGLLPHSMQITEAKRMIGGMSEDEIVEQLQMRRTHVKRVLTLINGKGALEEEQFEAVSGSISFHPSSDWSVEVADPTKMGTGSKAKMAYKITHQRASEGELQVTRFYSDFTWLRKTLSRRYLGCVIPPLPAEGAREKALSVLATKVGGAGKQGIEGDDGASADGTGRSTADGTTAATGQHEEQEQEQQEELFDFEGLDEGQEEQGGGEGRKTEEG
jgi:hypothetical protein